MLDAGGGSRRLGYTAVALIAILVLAANLRAAISAVGPVLPMIAEDLALSDAVQGVLTAAPIAAFALVSPFGHRIAARLGVEAAVVLALGLIALGIAMRSIPIQGAAAVVVLVLATAVLGGGVAVANVLLPVLARRDFPARVPTVTGHYIALQSAVAALAAAVAVPVAAIAGWRTALGVWLLPVAIALVVWVIHRRGAAVRGEAPAPTDASSLPRSPWTSPAAWQLAIYFGLQSCSFYLLLGWLPTIEQELGISAGAAGFHLGVFLVVGIAANVVVPPCLNLGGDQRLVASVVALIGLVAVFGLWAWPAAAPWWVGLAGFGAGASMVVALSLIPLRSAVGADSGPLSSMVQGVGYAGVTIGLLLVGWAKQTTGSSAVVVAVVLGLAVVQALVGLLVGRDRRG
ncbi:MFS transporter [Aeromicrobium phragmitis]|uniref:MFS transporter n=1 Tax=Aeromicrobium phragmitis TaxID=2478914 RepID=A0A3L8PS60_9ACTN|nr:MFS transporter [Aeromicrobium phragmitis]RLV57228.1 MFS transporter [Aeromicrobium phragmitis]